MKTSSFLAAVAVAMPLAVTATPAFAGPVVAGFDTTSLTRNDDGSTGFINVTSTFGASGLNFFGATYTGLFVNNNGNVTFGASTGQFTPVGLGAAYNGLPIIAPFFADVDTRSGASGVTSYGAGSFAGRDTFGVTWPGVGYFSGQADKLNVFQLLLTDRSDTGGGNFDIYFNYDQIQWETGSASGGAGGFGGASAAAGFSKGTGEPSTFFQLAGSLVNGALLDGGVNSLSAGSNTSVAGRYLFTVRNGEVEPGVVPEPTTWAMMLTGFFGAGAYLRRRRAVAA